VAACCLLIGCGDDGAAATPQPKAVTLTGTTTCARYASLASALGCVEPTGCTTDAACETQGMAWVDCAAKDTSQCHCEKDGDLNCEGSFKANEGPARCKAEYTALADCSGG